MSILYSYWNGRQCNIQSIHSVKSWIIFLRKINYHGQYVEMWNLIESASNMDEG